MDSRRSGQVWVGHYDENSSLWPTRGCDTTTKGRILNSNSFWGEPVPPAGLGDGKQPFGGTGAPGRAR